MDRSLHDEAVRLYDDFTHDHRDRRTLLRQMTALAGSAAAAELLIAGIAASPAAAALTQPGDPRIVTRKGGYAIGLDQAMQGYFAAPRGSRRKVGAVIVIHENRGLTPHIEDVTRRLAIAGFFAVAPDFLSSLGGTPADEDRAREMIASLDLGLAVRQAAATAGRLSRLANGTGKVGAVGFCWGGAMVNRLAVADPSLDAAVAYYGPAPDPAEAAKVRAPLMLHYAGKDARVATTGEPWVAALRAAGRPVEAFTYAGVDHAFNNDTSPDRYNAETAALAWGRTLAFLHRHLDR